MGQTVYVFETDLPQEEVIQKLSVVGKCREARQGYVRSAVGLWGTKVEFYVGEGKVRAVVAQGLNIESLNTGKDIADKLWDKVLESIPLDTGLEKSDNLYIAAAQNLSGDTTQVYTAKTKGGVSLAGFLLGGFFAGDAGAIVGGLSGRRTTKGQVSYKAAKKVYIRAVMSNGRVTQGWVKTDSPVYHQIKVM